MFPYGLISADALAVLNAHENGYSHVIIISNPDGFVRWSFESPANEREFGEICDAVWDKGDFIRNVLIVEKEMQRLRPTWRPGLQED